MAMSQEQLDAFLARIPSMNAEEQVRLYTQVREMKVSHTRTYDAEQAQFKTIMETCENMMLSAADAQGVSGFKTDYGTTYVSQVTKVSVADHGAFSGFLDSLPAGGERYAFFEQRISSRAVEDHIKATGGTPPPGLNIFRNRVMRVRKAGEK